MQRFLRVTRFFFKNCFVAMESTSRETLSHLCASAAFELVDCKSTSVVEQSENKLQILTLLSVLCTISLFAIASESSLTFCSATRSV